MAREHAVAWLNSGDQGDADRWVFGDRDSGAYLVKGFAPTERGTPQGGAMLLA